MTTIPTKQIITLKKPVVTGFRSVRNKAEKLLDTLDIPTKKDEAWKYTDISHIFNKIYEHLPAAELTNISEMMQTCVTGDHIVFIDGIYSKQFSTYKNNSDLCIYESILAAEKDYPEVVKKYFNTLLPHDDYFGTLNTAVFEDGLFMHIHKGLKQKQPIIITHILSEQAVPTFVQPRNCIIIDDDAQVHFIFNYISNSTSFSACNAVTELFIGENAHANCIYLNNGAEGVHNINSLYSSLQGNATLNNYFVDLYNALNRNSVTVRFEKEHSQTNLYGISLLKDNQHMDTCTNIDHAMPSCTSNELFKGIYTDNATGVFNGKILVRPDAQKTQAFQKNNVVLLSDNAKSYSKPSLEIFADDVKCSHGATSGQIDPHALFYLQARGIPPEKAKKMLLYAFSEEIIDKIPHDGIKKHLEILIENRLQTMFSY